MSAEESLQLLTEQFKSRDAKNRARIDVEFAGREPWNEDFEKNLYPDVLDYVANSNERWAITNKMLYERRKLEREMME